MLKVQHFQFSAKEYLERSNDVAVDVEDLLVKVDNLRQDEAEVRARRRDLEDRLTVGVVRSYVQGLGLKMRYRGEYHEFRIARKNLMKEVEEATAYYTDDPEDAVRTARIMAKEENNG